MSGKKIIEGLEDAVAARRAVHAPTSGVPRIVRGLICRITGHRWRVFSDGFKRECRMCGREDWVMSRPYPLIGQAKYFWERMDRTWR